MNYDEVTKELVQNLRSILYKTRRECKIDSKSFLQELKVVLRQA